MKLHCLLFIVGLLLAVDVCVAKPPHPHIILIVADDLGWDDVSFHGSTEIPTPNIDSLAKNGVILHNYYVMPLCTPTRSALMTGRHPIHLGLQHDTIGGAQPYGLGLNETLISQLLKGQGYKTHIVGKWHLGMFAKEYLPLNRGFDSHFGYLLGHEDYWDHTAEASPSYLGFDFQRNSQIYTPVFGQYGTEIFTAEAKRIITSHNTSQPLFLYLAQQAVHAGNSKHPLQAPAEYVERFSYITNEKRRVFAGMVSALDDSVGSIVTYLNEAGLYKDSVIIFTTDNGGAGHGYDGSVGCNWPLRGMKSTPWEGGVRGVGFVNSPLLDKPRRVSGDLIHVSDWFPTMYRIAGGNVSALGDNIYGKDVWDTVSEGAASPRNEILLNIDSLGHYAALRIGDYKIVIGDSDHGAWDNWYPPLGVSTETQDKKEEGLKRSMGPRDLPPVVSCLLPRPSNASTNCKPFEKPCLFDIRNDPCEFYNIASWNPDILSQMMTRLNQINATAVPPRNKPNDPKGDPKLHGGDWVPWVKLDQVNPAEEQD